MTAGISYKLSYRQQTNLNTAITKLQRSVRIWAYYTLKIFQKMRMSEKCLNRNKNSGNPLTSRPTDGGKDTIKSK